MSTKKSKIKHKDIYLSQNMDENSDNGVYGWDSLAHAVAGLRNKETEEGLIYDDDICSGVTQVLDIETPLSKGNIIKLSIDIDVLNSKKCETCNGIGHIFD